MMRLKYIIIAQLLIIPMLFPLILANSPTTNINRAKISTSDYGVSKYTVNNYVTYDVAINLSLTHISGPINYTFKVSRLDNREPNAPLNTTAHTPEYQKSELVYHSISGASGIYGEGYQDEFNNTYDKFNKTNVGTVRMDQRYTVTLKSLNFSSIADGDIGAYTPGDYAHALYNRTEDKYNCSDPNLIALSNTIVGTSTNLVEKAQKIYNWIAANLVYQVQDDDMGATWAYTNMKGDCSEYSSLMITLLRIQGIPARKVTGYVITNNPTSVYPQVGDTYTFNLTTSTGAEWASTLLGHAWIEYYIPNIGWIVCDPTWHELNYFNSIDYFHLSLNIGAWFSIPASPWVLSEFGSPVLASALGSTYSCIYSITLTVTGTDVVPPPPDEIDWVLIIIIILIVAVIGIVAIILIKKLKD